MSASQWGSAGLELCSPGSQAPMCTDNERYLPSNKTLVTLDVSFAMNKNMRAREKKRKETKHETERKRQRLAEGKEQVSSCAAICLPPQLSIQCVLFWFFNRWQLPHAVHSIYNGSCSGVWTQPVTTTGKTKTPGLLKFHQNHHNIKAICMVTTKVRKMFFGFWANRPLKWNCTKRVSNVCPQQKDRTLETSRGRRFDNEVVKSEGVEVDGRVSNCLGDVLQFDLDSLLNSNFAPKKYVKI